MFSTEAKGLAFPNNLRESFEIRFIDRAFFGPLAKEIGVTVKQESLI